MHQEIDTSSAMNLMVYGHGVIEELLYTVNGIFRKIPGPGGALFVQAALHSIQTQQSPPPPQGSILPPFDEEILEKSDEFRREYKALRRYEDGTGRAYYAVSRYLGYSEGASSHSIYCIPPCRREVPTDVILWDEGFGGLTLPQDCRSVLWSSNKALPNREEFEKVSQKCFLFIDANVLREP